MQKKTLIPLLTALLALTFSLTACQSGDTSTTKPSGTGFAHHHEYIERITEPTCEEDGYTEHICHICGERYTDNVISKRGHSYEDFMTPATCDTEGSVLHICSQCGHRYTDGRTPATGHTFLDHLVDPTCTQEGYTEHICKFCLISYRDTTVAMTAHSYHAEVIAPTGTEQGYTEHTCTHCGDSYRDTFTEPVAHRNIIVNFHPEGGTMAGHTTAIYRTGEEAVLPIPTREGYTFEGWYIDPEDSATLVESGLWSITTDTSLTALWSRTEVSLRFEVGSEGESAYYPAHVLTWGDPVGTLPTPTARFGYTFDGWYDGNTRITPDTVSKYTEPVTLTAKWFAPIRTGHHGDAIRGYDWAVYSDGTLRFLSGLNNAMTGELIPFAIADDAFRGMAEIRAVVLPSQVTDVGNFAFADCPNLTYVYFSGSAGVIRASVFEGCTALTRITVGDGIRVINEDAFRGCSSLAELDLPLSLYQIYSPFEGCTALSHIRYEGSDFQWGVILKDTGAQAALAAEKVTVSFMVSLPAPR